MIDRATYGADCTIAVEPTRPIEGVVRDIDTKDPIPGAIITAFQLSGSTASIEGLISTESDAQGRYRLVGLPKGDRHKLAVYPPLDRPYFITKFLEVAAGPGIDPVKFDIGLKRGIWITGKATDVATGRPVAAVIDYFPFLSNPHAEHYPNFDPRVTSIAVKTRYKTDGTGQFRLVGLPGGGVVTARTDDRSYRAGVGADAIKGRTEHGELLTYDRISPALYRSLKEVNVPEGADSFACDLGLDPGGSVRVRIVDEAGTPVTGATMSGRFADWLDNGDHNLYDESLVRVGGLAPGEPRTLLIQHRGRKIGTVYKVAADDPRNDAEIKVTLRATATLTGRLVDAQGRPAHGGVRVQLISAPAASSVRQQVASQEVDADGRFRCELVPAGGPYEVTAANRLVHAFGPRMEPDAFQPFELTKKLTVEPGQTVDFGTFDVNAGKHVNGPPTAQAAVTDVPINGRIVDLEGRPVAGVSVKVESVRIPKSDDLTPWLEGVKKGEPPWVVARHIDWERKAPETAAREATTDADGRFRLAGFGAERAVSLGFRGDTIAYTTIDVVTRTTDPVQARGFSDNHGPGPETIYGAVFTYTARPGRRVEGVVRDAKTGEPMGGVAVESYRFAGSDFVDTRALKTTTGQDGRFRLVGLPKGRGNVVIAVPNDDQPYFMQEVNVGDPPGIDPVNVPIGLHRGIWIIGKVTDKATGEPVQNARLHYLPFLDNTFVQGLPEFDKNGNVDGSQMRYQTKADGTYKLVGMPGRAIVGVDDDGKKTYRSGVGADQITGMDERVLQDLAQPDLGRQVLAQRDEGDQPAARDRERLARPSARPRTVHPAQRRRSGREAGRRRVNCRVRERRAREMRSGAAYELINYGPNEERTVMVRHEGKKLGQALRIKAGADAEGPVKITLAPLATIRGRTVDADGNPVPAARVRPDLMPGGDFSLHLPEVVSDKEGRFEVPNVPSGCEYGLNVMAGTMIKEHRYAHAKASVRPGETTDVGDIAFKKD